MFVKFWKPRKSWLDMPAKDRQEFVQRAQNGMAEIAKQGLKTLAWLQLDAVTPGHDTGFTFCSVYQVPDRNTAIQFHNAMMNFGWYKHFEQVNGIGEIESPGAVLARVLQLQPEQSA